MTPNGEAAVAGIVAGLPQVQAVLAGSVLSPLRLKPGNWAGAFACWGLENREAAVRFCAATPATRTARTSSSSASTAARTPTWPPRRCSAWRWTASSRELPLPPEVTVDPATLPRAAARTARAGGVPDRRARRARVASSLARRILGESIVDATLAVRRYEHATYGDADPAGRCRRRTAWLQLLTWAVCAPAPSPPASPVVPDELIEALSAPLVDHHVHSCFAGPVARAEFEECLNEASPEPVPAFMTQFDSQLGFAVRRWCAPLLGLEPHASADDYWARRTELGDEAVARALLPAAGVDRWIVDPGYAGDRVASTAARWPRGPAPRAAS